MGFLESSYLADNEEFVRRVRVALVTAAKNVMAEDNTTKDHATRVIYAKKVIDNPDVQTRLAVHSIVTNVAIDSTLDKLAGRYQTSASDSDIQFTVDSLFNALAGIST